MEGWMQCGWDGWRYAEVDEVEQRHHEVEVWMGWRDRRREQRWMRWSSGIMRWRCGWGGERDVLWDGTNVVGGGGTK